MDFKEREHWGGLQEGIEDDVLQMGGDFTIKTKNMENPTLCFSYPSKTPNDRPSIKAIFEKLRNNAKE